MFKKGETTSQEKIIDREDRNGTSLLPTENLKRQRSEGGVIILPVLIFLKYSIIILAF